LGVRLGKGGHSFDSLEEADSMEKQEEKKAEETTSEESNTETTPEAVSEEAETEEIAEEEADSEEAEETVEEKDSPEEPEAETAEAEGEASAEEAKAKSGFKTFLAGLKKGYAKFSKFFEGKQNLHTVLTVVLLPIILALIVEMLSRNSFLAGIRFLYQSPVPFFVNACIIACTVLIALVFKRRFFVYLVVSAFWIVLGVVNRQILMKRVTPFNGTDIFMVKTGMRIVGKYSSPATIILWAVLAAAVLALLVVVFIKGPKVKEKINRVRNALIVGTMVAVTFIAISLSIDTGRIAVNWIGEYEK